MSAVSRNTTAEWSAPVAEAYIEPKSGKTILPVRWVVLFTGNAGTDEYYPTASRGESDALTQEVSELCQAFHPHSQIHLFPKASAAYMFWRADSTGDWVITRVSVAPNPQGLRTALEYCSLIFDDPSFRVLRYNPFRTRSLNMHDRVRKHYLARQREPFEYTLPSSSAATSMPSTSHEEGDLVLDVIPDQAGVISDIRRMIPGITEDHLASVANVGAIQEYCSRWSDEPLAPPTFATWWSSRNPVPDGRFDVVLRAAAPRAMTWHEAARSVSQLTSDVKLTLPSPPAVDVDTVNLIRSILNTCAIAEHATTRTAGRAHSETADETQEQLQNIIGQIKELSTQLNAVTQRFAGQLTPEDAGHLTHLIDRSQDLQISLQTIVPSNPFHKSGSRITETRREDAGSATAQDGKRTAPGSVPFADAPTGEAVAGASGNPAWGAGVRRRSLLAPALAMVAFLLLTLWFLLRQ